MSDRSLNSGIDSVALRKRDALEAILRYETRSNREEFGVLDPAVASRTAEHWFHPDARHEHRFTAVRGLTPGAGFVLDLASGVGSAVLYGMHVGFEMIGLEPDREKLRLAKLCAEAHELPPAFARRFAAGVGERLPFKDHAFRAVLSYQTLEHVADPEAVLREMIRVTKPGGALHLRCPDYRGTFEGHYRLPWLPLLPRPLARLYLRLMGRTPAGLAGIRYVTRPGLIRSLRKIGSEIPSLRIRISDLDRERFLFKLRDRGLPGGSGLYPVWKLWRFLAGLFRRELEINLWVELPA